MTKQSKARRLAIRELNAYIDRLRDDYLYEGGFLASKDGTDGWTLSIDQYAHKAAKAEADEAKKERGARR